MSALKETSVLPCSITKYSLIIALSGLTLGLDIGSIGALVTEFKSFQLQYQDLTNFKTGLLISIFNLGGLIGGLFLGKYNNKKNKTIKYMVCLNTSVILLGQFLQLAGFSSWLMFVLGRFLFGFGQGGNNVLCPLYISEICRTFALKTSLNAHEKSLDGRETKVDNLKASYFQLLLTFGICLGNILNYFYVGISSSFLQWRLPIFTNFLATFAMLNLLYFLVPDQQELEHYMRREINFASTDTLISSKEKEIITEKQLINEKQFINEKQIIDETVTSGASFKEPGAVYQLWNGKPLYFWRVVIGSTIFIFQQFTGINYFFYYSALLFTQNNSLSANLINIILSSVNFIATVASLYLIKKISPKKMFLTGLVGCSITMFLFAMLGELFNTGMFQIQTLTFLMAAVASTFIIFFAICLGPVSFILVEQILPAEVQIKTLGLGIANSFNWITGFLVGALTPTMNSLIGLRLGYFFAGSTLIGLVFEKVYLPDMYGVGKEEKEVCWELLEVKDPRALVYF